jgi:hypothetical protein
LKQLLHEADASTNSAQIDTALLFLLSSLVRGNEQATKQMFEPRGVDQISGLEALALHVASFKSPRQRLKLMHFVSDISLFLHDQTPAENRPPIPAKYNRILQEWCSLFWTTATNVKEDVDLHEAALEGIRATPCLAPTAELQQWLKEQEQRHAE